MSKQYQIHNITLKEKEQFQMFMKNFMEQSNNDPNHAKNIVKFLLNIAPKEYLIQHLNVLKEQKEAILENYDAVNNGVTEEVLEENINNVQLIINGEVDTNFCSI